MLTAMRFSLAHLLLEVTLVAVCLAAIRLYPFFPMENAFAHLGIFTVATISGCTALGGLILRPLVGLAVGCTLTLLLGPFWFLIHASAAC
jgi:uncharacterized membrane protein